MKKNLLKSLLALALVSFGCMNVAAQEEGDNTAVCPVKMTYVSGTDADVDVAYGECDTIKAGWNHGNAVAVGTTIPLGNKNWGANWIGVLKVDLSAIPGTVQKATLKAMVSGSLDSKRNTGWGVALTDNEWSTELTYTTVSTWTVSAMLNGGVQVWTTSRSATGFEEISLDITDAFSAGQSSATLLVYEGIKDGNGGAAGGCMTEAVVEVEYEPFEATSMMFDFEDGNIAFLNGTNSGNGRVTAAIEANEELSSNVLGWTCAGNAQNGYSFSYLDFTGYLDNPALVRVEFDYYNTKGGRSIMTIGDALVRGSDGKCGKTSYNSTGAIFRIGSDRDHAYINGLTLPQDDVTTTTTYTVVDEETGESQDIEVEQTQPGLCGKWMHVILIVNNDARTVTWVVNDMEGDNLYYGAEPFFAEDAVSCTQIDMFGYINNSHCAMIDNLEITNYKSDAVFADYTIKYVDANGNDIKDSRTGNGQVGKYVKLLDSDKDPIRTDDMKYIYASDDSETVAIAEEGTVITVTFREAEKYYCVLNCCIDGQTMATGKLEQFRDNDKYWFWEGDNFSIRPAIAYVKDGKYYKVDPDSYNGKVFTFPGSVAPAVNGGKTYYIGTLYYTLDETIAYHSDFERLALPTEDAGDGTGLGQLVGTVNNWWSFSNGYFDRFSQGRGIRLDNGSYVWTEPIAEEGTYMVTIYGRNDKSENCVAPYALGLRDAEGNVTLLDVAVPDWGSATTGTNTIGNVAVEAQEATEESEAVEAKEATGIGILAGYSLVVMNTGNGSFISLDDIKLTKVADYAETPALNLYTATFDNAAKWEKVYAYAWSGEGEGVQEFLGTWPGTELKATDGVYTVSITAAAAPEFIIFNNGLEGDAKEQTPDLAFEDGKAYTIDVPATDIAIYPTGGDIAAALEEAKAAVAKVGNITINLAVDGVYTIGATLTAPNNIFIYGNEGTLTVADEMTDALITLDGTETFAMKDEETASDHKIINKVEVRGVTVKGLKGALVKDAQKTLVENLIIDWSNIEMPAAGKNVLDFNGKGYAGKVTVTNSTIWANGMNTGFFAQYGSRPKNVNDEWLQEFDIENSTFVNIANGKNVCDLKQNGTAQNVYTLKNNIFVDCGKSGQAVVGFNKGQTSATPVWAVEGNYFEWGGACVNAAEVEKAGKQNEEDIVKNCVEGELTFADAAAGDFNGEFELAEGAEAPAALGAPMWTITFKAAPVASPYYLVGNFTEWKVDEKYNLTLNSKAGEGIVEYKINVDLEADAQFKVVKSEDGSTVADEDWYPTGMGNNYGQNGELKAAGNYNVYFRPNADGGDDWFYKVLYVVDSTTDGINFVTIDTRDAVIYNISGQRVQNAQKGLYIQNGKKFIVK